MSCLARIRPKQSDVLLGGEEEEEEEGGETRSVHISELNQLVSQSGGISLRAACLRSSVREQYYQLADVVATATDAAVMQRASRRDTDRLYYYTVSKIMGYLKFSVTE